MDNTIAPIENEKIELSVSTKGVYTWTIKVFGLDVDKLESINNQLKAKFHNNWKSLASDGEAQ